jgi:hypothetical protein
MRRTPGQNERRFTEGESSEGLQNRGMTRKEVASYFRCSVAAVSDWVRPGIIPGPLPGTKRWDRRASAGSCLRS